MYTAHEIAVELRRIADALDKEPTAEVPQPLMTFHCDNYGDSEKSKNNFLTLARLLPKPLDKKFDNDAYILQHGIDGGTETAPVWIRAKVERKAVCTLVKPAQPAVYDCSPLLSPEEEASFETVQR
jgi:hypothetical protein